MIGADINRVRNKYRRQGNIGPRTAIDLKPRAASLRSAIAFAAAVPSRLPLSDWNGACQTAPYDREVDPRVA